MVAAGCGVCGNLVCDSDGRRDPDSSDLNDLRDGSRTCGCVIGNSAGYQPSLTDDGVPPFSKASADLCRRIGLRSRHTRRSCRGSPRFLTLRDFGQYDALCLTRSFSKSIIKSRLSLRRKTFCGKPDARKDSRRQTFPLYASSIPTATSDNCSSIPALLRFHEIGRAITLNC